MQQYLINKLLIERALDPIQDYWIILFYLNNRLFIILLIIIFNARSLFLSSVYFNFYKKLKLKNIKIEKLEKVKFNFGEIQKSWKWSKINKLGKEKFGWTQFREKREIYFR